MSNDSERTLADRYILDFERAGQVRSRRNALLANWIAIRTKYTDIRALTAEVLKVGATEAGDDDLCNRLLTDLEAWGIVLDSAELHDMAHSLLFDAARQLASEDEARTAQ